MKKIFVFLLLSITAVSCYEDYIYDYDYTSVYFPLQIDVRTFVVGEGMKVEVGTELGGVRENTRDRSVNFVLDNSLITPAILALMKGSSLAYIKNPATPVTTLLPLPANYYTLSDNSKIVIKKGQHTGTIIVKPDSATFLADPATTLATYVLPFSISGADADSILPLKKYEIVGFRYENMLFGNYWHGGSALVNRPAKSDTTFKYYTQVPQPEAKVWVLKTVGPNTLYANGYFDQVTAKNEMMLALDGNNITISTVAGSTWSILPESSSTFNRAKLLQNRKIVLKYKFVNTVNGYTYHCTDTLTFRNRIRDGVNEWQDENPSHYTN